MHWKWILKGKIILSKPSLTEMQRSNNGLYRYRKSEIRLVGFWHPCFSHLASFSQKIHQINNYLQSNNLIIFFINQCNRINPLILYGKIKTPYKKILLVHKKVNSLYMTYISKLNLLYVEIELFDIF